MRPEKQYLDIACQHGRYGQHDCRSHDRGQGRQPRQVTFADCLEATSSALLAPAATRCSEPADRRPLSARSEEHTSELQSLMRISYAVFCLKKKINKQQKSKNNIAHITY